MKIGDELKYIGGRRVYVVQKVTQEVPGTGDLWMARVHVHCEGLGWCTWLGLEGEPLATDKLQRWPRR